MVPAMFKQMIVADSDTDSFKSFEDNDEDTFVPTGNPFTDFKHYI